MVIKRRRTKLTKLKPLTTVEMEVAIARYFGFRQNIIVPNISWGLSGMHECDLFILKRSGYANEVEIKRTKADLLADFKKDHEHKDRQKRIQEFYYAMPIKLYDTCKDLIPKNAGILTCEKYQTSTYNKCDVYVKTQRKPVKDKLARKLTNEETLKVAHLGTMRIWSLKNKIIKMRNG